MVSREKLLLLTTIAKFASVGVANTIIDFCIFNVLTLKQIHFGRIQANFVSTTCAMIFSFFANQRFVFAASGGNFWMQVISFYAVTAFGVYVLQNLVIHTLSKRWTTLPDFAVNVAHRLGLKKVFSDDFVAKNTAKLCATVVSLTWNFILYKKVVFHA